MGNVLSLESFEINLPVADKSTVDYDTWYEQGFAAGMEAARSEIDQLNDQFIQAVSDIDFTYAEARGRVLKSLAPLFNALASQVLPQCVKNGFAGQLANELERLSGEIVGSPLTLCVHPNNQATASNLAAASPAKVTVHADPELSQHAAWIGPVRAEVLLDMDSLLSKIADTLNTINYVEQEAQTNG